MIIDTGTVVSNVDTPPAGGCRTSVEIQMDQHRGLPRREGLSPGGHAGQSPPHPAKVSVNCTGSAISTRPSYRPLPQETRHEIFDSFTLCWMVSWSLLAVAAESIPISSPGLPESHAGCGGTFDRRLGSRPGQTQREHVVDGPLRLESIRLDQVIPAAQAVSDRGSVRLTCTVYRAPAFPAGVDVLQVRARRDPGQPGSGDPVAGTAAGNVCQRLAAWPSAAGPCWSCPARSSTISRCGVGLRRRSDGAARLGAPAGACDPAFRNIRAGMGGVPIVYRFAIAPGGQRTSCWDSAKAIGPLPDSDR